MGFLSGLSRAMVETSKEKRRAEQRLLKAQARVELYQEEGRKPLMSDLEIIRAWELEEERKRNKPPFFSKRNLLGEGFNDMIQYYRK